MHYIRVRAWTPDGEVEAALIASAHVMCVTPGRIRVASGAVVRIDEDIPVEAVHDALVCSYEQVGTHPHVEDFVSGLEPRDDIAATVRRTADALRCDHGDPDGLGSYLVSIAARLAVWDVDNDR